MCRNPHRSLSPLAVRCGNTILGAQSPQSWKTAVLSLTCLLPLPVKHLLRIFQRDCWYYVFSVTPPTPLEKTLNTSHVVPSDSAVRKVKKESRRRGKRQKTVETLHFLTCGAHLRLTWQKAKMYDNYCSTSSIHLFCECQQPILCRSWLFSSQCIVSGLSPTHIQVHTWLRELVWSPSNFCLSPDFLIVRQQRLRFLFVVSQLINKHGKISISVPAAAVDCYQKEQRSILLCEEYAFQSEYK